MKKYSIYPVILCATIFFLSACKKASTKNVAQDWNVVEYVEFGEYQQNNGTYYSSEITFSQLTFTKVYMNDPETTPEIAYSGNVTNHVFSFNPDGTWIHELHYEYEDSAWMGNTSDYDIHTVVRGSWNFLDGRGEFRKNERIILNTLSTVSENSSHEYDFTLGEMAYSTVIDTITFIDGEHSEIFIIDDVTAKAMTLVKSGKTEESDFSFFSGDPIKSVEITNKTFKLAKY